MNIGKTNLQTASAAAAVLDEGGVCALPTETVYGLAADAANGEAVAEIYQIKGRPHFNPLIAHVDGLAMAEQLVVFDQCAHRQVARFWPGPLTLVLPRRADAPVAALASAGLSTLAVRVPHHPLTREVIAALGRPIVAPSANRSGRLSPTSATHVHAEFGDRVPVLDGGPCARGIESTIISLVGSRPTLLRPGALPVQEIEAVLGHPLQPPGDGIEAPGMMASHYAPQAALRLNAQAPHPGERLLGFGGTPGATLDLSPRGDLREAAANLFDFLRRLDDGDGPIAVAPIPQSGLGVAINDRLSRAAAPRDGAAPQK